MDWLATEAAARRAAEHTILVSDAITGHPLFFDILNDWKSALRSVVVRKLGRGSLTYGLAHCQRHSDNESLLMAASFSASLNSKLFLETTICANSC